MIRKLFAIIYAFLVWTSLFLTSKIIFIWFNNDIFHNINVKDIMHIMWNGLALDASVAGYLTIVPTLLLFFSLFIKSRFPYSTISYSRGYCINYNRIDKSQQSKSSLFLHNVCKVYIVFASFLVVTILLLNIVLYKYWGFPIDNTPFFYFFSSPAAAFASVEWWQSVLFIAIIIVFTIVVSWIFFKILNRNTYLAVQRNTALWKKISFILPTLFILFYIIRGGFSVATMNSGRAYFSANTAYNHAAVNALISLTESISHENDFKNRYKFMSDNEAEKIFNKLMKDKYEYVNANKPQLLKNTKVKPNVILVILESFSSHLLTQTGAKQSGIAPCLDSIASQNLLFTNCYCTSFRTDRGLISILSGFPSQPTSSIMKYPKKSEKLSSIPKTLKKNNYSTLYFYGGDANFTNMRSYLTAQNFEQITEQKNFSISETLSKWGAPDHILFEKAYTSLTNQPKNKPYFAVIQTSSSHEPYDVPYKKFSNKPLNAFAYTDSVVGNFVSKLKKLPDYENTLIIFVPDHQGSYPKFDNNFNFQKYKIPLIFAGGALNIKGKMNAICSQQDIAATLLSALNIDYSEFTFSRNIYNSPQNNFAFLTFPDAFGFINYQGGVIFNNTTNSVEKSYGKNKNLITTQGKAYLQYLYKYLSTLQ